MPTTDSYWRHSHYLQFHIKQRLRHENYTQLISMPVPFYFSDILLLRYNFFAGTMPPFETPQLPSMSVPVLTFCLKPDHCI